MLVHVHPRRCSSGKPAPRNPWGSAALEWKTPTPPPLYNFVKDPVLTRGPYDYHLATDDELYDGYDDPLFPGRETTAQQGSRPKERRTMSTEAATEHAPRGGHARAWHGHHGPKWLAHHFDTPAQQFDAAKLGMWVFLAQELLFFSGLFVAYGVYRSWYPEMFRRRLTSSTRRWAATNTVVLLFSSLDGRPRGALGAARQARS